MASASALDVSRPGTPSAFDDQAGRFLAAREAGNNLMLGLISGLQRGRAFGPQPPFFVVVRDRGDVIGAAMRTPPFNLILASGSEARALTPILDRLAAETTDLTGVSGPKDLVKIAADMWSQRMGVAAHLQMAERIYQLRRVVPPRAVAGSMRRARGADRDVIASWMYAFVEEAQPHLDRSIEAARENADRWIDGGTLRVWEDSTPVSMAGASGPTPRGIRVSAVYTPPEMRRRGYASALVAALSQEQLHAGKNFCFLYTDLANPTSNKIYQDIGYEPVCDVDEYRFEGAPPTTLPATPTS
jgi:predicted GNAT family acetyltransferase